ncbi:GNAT family N-acetyltransferase [Bythopirellula polymerisocia]|uniref:Acetyltransferase (GNAT) family protein n=1 Tax=Bythopirellula polymerisocia TaxID=2528003 RepID=A0A5C6CYL0_9BACT|nr:GNAT family N-acetyltransferase [Bythopirellula polymerisocia]TWU30023.1 Acetyltransferase (GNAT) family protein [Bythopirellula polymerisocia]
MISLSTHDGCPQEVSAIIDSGIGEANDAAAPLHEVQPISCFARSGSGSVVGGAIGRRWGACCELQQLWVAPSHRRQGIGSQLLMAFEEHAKRHGCTYFCLETFSFQTPELYQSRGYQVEYERKGYPHRIVKYHMIKQADKHNGIQRLDTQCL